MSGNSLAEALAKSLQKQGVTSDEAPTYGLRLSTGVPHLDFILSGKYRDGGLQTGRIHEIAGPPSSGKTLIAQHVMLMAQLAGGAVAFHDHERTFDQNLYQSFGGDISPGIFTYKRPRTFEESIDLAIDWMEAVRKADVIPFEAPLVCVFDSFAAMVPAEKMDREGKDAAKAHGQAANMRQKVSLATASSQELPAFSNFVEENNICAIFLNQIGTKPGVVYGDPRYTKGGDSMPYYCSTRTWLSRAMVREGKDVVGQTVTAETIKNKTHRPFLKSEFVFKFKEDGTGYIDVMESMLDHVSGLGKLSRSGAWYDWDGQRYQGKDQLLAALRNDPGALDKLIDLASA